MSEHQGTIIYRIKNKLVPKALVDLILAKHPHSIVGYALRQGESVNLVTETGGNINQWDSINALQEAAPDCNILFMLMHYPAKYHEEDEQPFTMLWDKDNNPLLVGCATGKFDNFIPAASDHSNEYFMFNKWLIPKIKKLYEYADKDLSKLFNELNDPLTKQDFDNACRNGSTIALLSATGREMMFYDHQDHAKHTNFDWGYATDSFGYKEAEAVVAQPITKAVGSMFKKKIIGEAAQKVPDSRPIIAAVEPVKTETRIPDNVAGTEYCKPPPKDMSRNKQKSYWHNRLGFLPKDWEDFPTHYKMPIKDFKDLPAANVNTARTAEDKVDTSGTGVTTETLPIMSPKIIESINHDFNKVLDKNSGVVPLDPEKIQEEEDKHPTFGEATGLGFDSTDKWPFATILSLCEKYPKGAAILLCNYRAADLARIEEAAGTANEAIEAEAVESAEPPITDGLLMGEPEKKAVTALTQKVTHSHGIVKKKRIVA